MDPYWMAVASIDEALRNVVCVGGDPARTAILDNFCWPRVDDKRNLGALVRACQACYDAAMVYGTPFISGKDSLNNEFAMNDADAAMVHRVIEANWGGSPAGTSDGRLAIPYTLLISALALIDDVDRCVSSALKPSARTTLYYFGADTCDWPRVDLASLALLHRELHRLIVAGDILAAHDCSEGGPAVAVAEMAIGADAGVQYHVTTDGLLANPFVEVPSGYIVQMRGDGLDRLRTTPGLTVQRVADLAFGVATPTFGFVQAGRQGEPKSVSIRDLRAAWRSPLDW
jgi:phosphoribosylformylglycinamidine synthase